MLSTSSSSHLAQYGTDAQGGVIPSGNRCKWTEKDSKAGSNPNISTPEIYQQVGQYRPRSFGTDDSTSAQWAYVYGVKEDMMSASPMWRQIGHT